MQSPGAILILYGDGLKPAADAWAQYRGGPGGWGITTHAVHASADPTSQQRELQQLIREAFQPWKDRNPQHFCVLLLGDANPNNALDPKLTAPGSNICIPTWYFPQTDPAMGAQDDPEFISDQPYQTLHDGDDQPAFPLGRIPARSNEEALIALERIKHYESTQAAGNSDPSRHRITYVAGEGRFGAMDGVLESLFKSMVDQMVPDAFDLSMTYAKATSVYCPPPSTLTDTVLERLSEGCILFNYLGHGHPRGLDSLHWGTKRIPILRVKDLDRLPPAHAHAQLPIAFMSCCSVGHFDLPNGDHCLSEAMLFASQGGPVAVISGSRVTHPYANTVLQKDITHALLIDRAPTVGMLDLLADRSLLTIDETDKQLDALAAPIALAGKWATSLNGLRRMHVKLYNLLGDPATRINLPPPPERMIQMKLEGHRLTGTIEGMKTGHIEIRLQTARTSFANPDQIKAVTDDRDPELEAKAANNYPLANQRALKTLEATVTDGQFEVMLGDPLPAAMAMVTATATGSDEAGETIEAIGALRLNLASAVSGVTATSSGSGK